MEIRGGKCSLFLQARNPEKVEILQDSSIQKFLQISGAWRLLTCLVFTYHMWLCKLTMTSWNSYSSQITGHRGLWEFTILKTNWLHRI